MAWPTTTRRSFWGRFFERSKRDYAAVAGAVGEFEPVVMVCNPGDAGEVREYCGGDVEPLELPIDDSWMRDCGPIFVTNGKGEVALVQFRFNSWGEKYFPYEKDAAVPERLAEHFGMRRYRAPFVLEGGAFFVDGEGTLITTQCVVNPNRNPTMSREEIEESLGEYLGVSRVIWLQAWPDRDTDGHVDGIAQYVRPGAIMLFTPRDPANHNHPFVEPNLLTLRSTTDAAGRALEVIPLEVACYAEADGERVEVPYLNFYLANGGVVVPTGGVPEDDEALARIAETFPGRKVVGVPGVTLSIGGGGPHCITQQVPVGVPVR